MLSFTNFLNNAVTRGLSFKAAKRAFQGFVFLDLYLAHLIPSLYFFEYHAIIQQGVCPVKQKQQIVADISGNTLKKIRQMPSSSVKSLQNVHNFAGCLQRFFLFLQTKTEVETSFLVAEMTRAHPRNGQERTLRVWKMAFVCRERTVSVPTGGYGDPPLPI